MDGLESLGEVEGEAEGEVEVEMEMEVGGAGNAGWDSGEDSLLAVGVLTLAVVAG